MAMQTVLVLEEEQEVDELNSPPPLLPPAPTAQRLVRVAIEDDRIEKLR
jgi:hypothetical protein